MSRVNSAGTIIEGIQTVSKCNKFFTKMEKEERLKEFLQYLKRLYYIVNKEHRNLTNDDVTELLDNYIEEYNYYEYGYEKE